MKPFPPMIPPTPFLSASCDSAHGAQSYLRLSECEFLIVSAFWGGGHTRSAEAVRSWSECFLINWAQIIKRKAGLAFNRKVIKVWDKNDSFLTFCFDSSWGGNCANLSCQMYAFLHKSLVTHFDNLLHNWIRESCLATVSVTMRVQKSGQEWFSFIFLFIFWSLGAN